MLVGPYVAIRVDASLTMGTGHLRRCISLAQALLELGARVNLFVRRLDEVAAQVLNGPNVPDGLGVNMLQAPNECTPEEGGPPHQLWAGVHWTQDVDEVTGALCNDPPEWIVVDHYAFDVRWHESVRSRLGCRMLVIDDTADRTLAADIMLDQNWTPDHRAKYAPYLPNCNPRWLIGPRFALLSNIYRRAPKYSFHSEVRSIGIFVGGTDPGRASARALIICRSAGFLGPIEVVSTSVNPHLDELRKACINNGVNTSLTLDEPDLAHFFSRHDLQIGAGGGATWERCCIGVPTIALVLAANQMAVVPALDNLRVLRAAQLDDDNNLVELPTLSTVLASMLADPLDRYSLGECAVSLVDGRGAQRVALSLIGSAIRLRHAHINDAQLLHEWRNHPDVRGVSGSSKPIDLYEHRAWMQRVIAASDRWLFVAEVGRMPVGCIRFDQGTIGSLVVSLYLDPELSGLGLGRRLLLAGEEIMVTLWGHHFTIDANVMPGNEASQNLFKVCGYSGGPLHYRKTVSG
jgi:UDP-2,4-diacetamido-2,4,6-trideoxy-beta-L-altropyranose hydrolase